MYIKNAIVIMAILGTSVFAFDNLHNSFAEPAPITKGQDEATLHKTRKFAESVGVEVHSLEYMASMPECMVRVDDQLDEMRQSNPDVHIMNLKDHIDEPNTHAFVAAQSSDEAIALYCLPTKNRGDNRAAYLKGVIKTGVTF